MYQCNLTGNKVILSRRVTRCPPHPRRKSPKTQPNRKYHGSMNVIPRAHADRGFGSYVCASCGQTSTVSLSEHYKQVHQAECTILFKGERQRVPCKRDADGLWRCPRCDWAVEGSSRKIQVSSGTSIVISVCEVLYRITGDQEPANRH